MRFGTPLALLLLLIIPYLIWLGRPRRAAANREWLSLALRLAIVLLLTLGLAGTRLVRAADGLALVFLVLLPPGKSGGVGDMFGGGMGGGAVGGSTVMEKNLDRLTVITAVLFAISTLGLTWLLA